MGFFSNPADKYSQSEKSLTTADIKRLVSRTSIKTLDQSEEGLVESELIARKGLDGRISMRQIYQVLISLEQRHKISTFDRKKLLKIFEQQLDT